MRTQLNEFTSFPFLFLIMFHLHRSQMEGRNISMSLLNDAGNVGQQKLSMLANVAAYADVEKIF